MTSPYIWSSTEDLTSTSLDSFQLKIACNVDNLLRKIVGPFGLWQLSIVLLMSLTISSSVTFPIFANNEPMHRCRMDEPVELAFAEHNLTFEQIARLIGPWQDGDSAASRHHQSFKAGCYHFKQNWTHLSTLLSLTTSSHLIANASPAFTRDLEPCSRGFVYQPKDYQYPGTVVEEFDTVCSREWLTPLSTSIYMLGMGTGFALGGWCGDIIGRKRTCILFWLIELISAPLIIFAPNYILFVLGRTAGAVSISARVGMFAVLRVEITTARYRSIQSAIVTFTHTIVIRSSVSLLAYLLPNWRWFHASLLSPSLLGIVYLVIPESPRWLMSQRRTGEALRILQTGQHVNAWVKRSPVSRPKGDEFFAQLYEKLDKLTAKSSSSHFQQHADSPMLPRELQPQPSANNQPCNTKKRLSLGRMFSDRGLCKTLALCCGLLTGHIMSFYGILFFARFTRSSIYIANLINTLTALPAVALFTACYQLSHHRRRPIIILYSLVAGVLCVGYLVNLFYPTPSDIVLTVCTNLALVMMGSCFEMLFIYIPELFPCEIRTQGFGMASGVSRIGTIPFTFVNQYMQHYSHGLPLLIYALVLLVGLTVLCFMTETSGENLSNCIGDRPSKPNSSSFLVCSLTDLAAPMGSVISLTVNNNNNLQSPNV